MQTPVEVLTVQPLDEASKKLLVLLELLKKVPSTVPYLAPLTALVEQATSDAMGVSDTASVQGDTAGFGAVRTVVVSDQFAPADNGECSGACKGGASRLPSSPVVCAPEDPDLDLADKDNEKKESLSQHAEINICLATIVSPQEKLGQQRWPVVFAALDTMTTKQLKARSTKGELDGATVKADVMKAVLETSRRKTGGRATGSAALLASGLTKDAQNIILRNAAAVDAEWTEVFCM